MAKDTTQDGARQKALDLALKQIEKQFGKGSVMKLGDAPPVLIDAIPTGSLALDHALGIGGVPRGRVIEIYGPESSGKTTLATQIIAEAQKLGGTCRLHRRRARLRRDLRPEARRQHRRPLISQPDTGEQALEIVDMLIRSGALDVIVVDSVAALVPRAEIEGEMGDSHVGLQARLMSQALRKLTGTINRTKTCLIFINQIREKIGVMFGSPETTTGGRALKFYASVRMDIRRIGADQGRDRHRRQPDPRQGRQEQGGPAVPPGRVRHHLRRGRLVARRARGHGRRAQRHHEERVVVLVQRRQHRAGPRRDEAVAPREPLLLDDERDFKPAYLMTLTEAGTIGVVFALKNVIQRPRPYASLSTIAPRSVRHDDTFDPYSFPSGHAAVSFALATSASLSFPRWYVIAPSVVWATAVTVSRPWLGVHYPTDVAVGAALGIGAAIGVHALGELLTPGFLRGDADDGAERPAPPPVVQFVIPF
jgi:protein RecA